MKKFAGIVFILFAVSIFAQSGADICSQSKISALTKLQKLEKVSYPGDQTINVTYYKLDLKISYDNKYLIGNVNVKAKPENNPVNSFYLDLYSGYKINSVKSNGVNLQYVLDQSHHLNITLDKSYSGNEEFSVDIFYEGTPPNSGSFGGSFVFANTNSGEPVIWTLSEPYGARDWWPCKDTPADKADSSDVWITADSFFTTASNGILEAEINNSDGTKTFKWHNSYPIANYLISIAMSNYDLYLNNFEYQPDQKMPITNYVYKGNVSRYKNVLDRVPKMLKIFSDKFGMYPFVKEKYGHAEFGYGGGMEHQTCTSLGAFSEDVISHELAHQWFGDKVTCKTWNNIWLNESFASYAECIYREEMYGEDNFKNYVESFMNNYAIYASGSIYIPDAYLNNVNYVFDTRRTYKKGAVVLHMLRGITGDEKFFQILKQYAGKPGLSYNVATTQDFQNVADSESGMDLKYFFDEWIYGENYPIYTFGWDYKKNDGDNYTLHLSLSQKSNSNPQFFKMPIQIKYTTATETKTIKVFNDTQYQNWEIQVNGQPLEVNFDPDNWILKTLKEEHTNVDDGNITSKYILLQNYPNPFNPGTTIEYEIPFGNNVLLKIYDAMGREIKTLVNKFQNAGTYKISFDAQKLLLPSGIYFYKLETGNSAQTRKMLYLK